MISRDDIHAAIDKQLDEWKYGETIPIERGMLGFEIQIENGDVSLLSKERHRKQVIRRR